MSSTTGPISSTTVSTLTLMEQFDIQGWIYEANLTKVEKAQNRQELAFEEIEKARGQEAAIAHACKHNFDFTSSFFRDYIVEGFYKDPQRLRTFGNHGYNFDSDHSIQLIKDFFSQDVRLYFDPITQQGYPQYAVRWKPLLGALKIVGEFSQSKEMSEVISKCDQSLLKTAFETGKGIAFYQSINQYLPIHPDLEDLSPTKIVMDYLFEEEDLRQSPAQVFQIFQKTLMNC